MAFKTQMKIHFDEADPAGIAFSGGLFTKIHRCYEDFVEALGQDPKTFFLDSALIYPLRHFEAEYLGPLRPLNTYEVNISVIKVSDSSFQLQYHVGPEEKALALFRSTHVAVQKENFKKVSIPNDLKLNLKTFLNPQ